MDFTAGAVIGFILGHIIVREYMLHEWIKDVAMRNKRFYEILQDRKHYKVWLGRFKVITEERKK